MLYIITYDLSEETDYSELLDEIKRNPWARLCESSYLTVTDESSKELRNRLKKVLDDKDILFVAQIKGSSAWSGLPKSVSKWIHKHYRDD